MDIKKEEELNIFTDQNTNDVIDNEEVTPVVPLFEEVNEINSSIPVIEPVEEIVPVYDEVSPIVPVIEDAETPVFEVPTYNEVSPVEPVVEETEELPIYN